MPPANFTVWDRQNLERFARQAADENLVLREENAELRAAVRVLLDSYRASVRASLENLQMPENDCPELGKTCNRPGAYDAYALPSLMGGKLVMPKGVGASAAAPVVAYPRGE